MNLLSSVHDRTSSDAKGNPPLGVNRARVFNATNRVLIGEPFDVTTLRFRGGRRVPTVLRLFVTGINRVGGDFISLRIGDVEIFSEITDPR